jgi:hypothetical protein
MTTHQMTPRQIRRAAEREARKAENKQPQAPVTAAATPAAEQETTSAGHAGSTISEAQLAANRANAQHSTGPTSPEGRESPTVSPEPSASSAGKTPNNSRTWPRASTTNTNPTPTPNAD